MCGSSRSSGSGVRVQPDLDPVVEREAGVLAEVLDRPLELAGVALGQQLRRQLRVDHDDEALVAGDRRAGSRRRQHLDLVGGERDATEGHGAVRRGTRPRHPGPRPSPPGSPSPRRLPIFGSSGFTRRSTRSDSSPISSTDADVDLVADECEQRVPLAEVAAGQRDPEAGKRLADADPGRAAERPGKVHGPARGRHRLLERLVAERGQLVGRPGRQVDASRVRPRRPR